MPPSERLENDGLLKLSERGSLLVTRDQGEPIREELLRLLQEHQRVVVDLNDVEAFTPSFMDEVLGKCLAQIGPDEFRRTVKLESESAEVRKLTNLVLSNRSSKTFSER